MAILKTYDIDDLESKGAFGPLQMTARTAEWLGLEPRRMRALRTEGLQARAIATRYAARAGCSTPGTSPPF